jgi:NADH-quinone oxidoreductase subunit J
MTTRPRPIDIDRSIVPGLAAVALLVVMGVVFVTAEFGSATGFPADESVVAGIGTALLGLTNGEFVPEGFLVALILIAVVLDAALDGALMLAKRDRGEE